MRLATCVLYLKPDGYNREFPYIAQSPITRQRVEYNCVDDLGNEIERILQDPDTKKFGIGISLYYQSILFCDPQLLIPYWCWDLLDDYHCCKRYNIPLANNLDEAPSWTLDCFDIIEEEIAVIQGMKKEKNGKE